MQGKLKEITIVIRPERWKDTREAIYRVGNYGMTQQRALGRGTQSGLHYLSLLSVDGPQTVGYLPKRLISCIVPAEDVDRLVQEIIRVNQTGNPGDGKIFVSPVEDCVRVRTAERGEEAV